MSWISETANMYDEISRKWNDSAGVQLIPLYHSTSNSQVEVTVFSDGVFSHAESVSSDDKVTIIPVTEDSSARGNGIMPHPLCDKLIYVAGDYCEYFPNVKKDAGKAFEKYIESLKAWADSEYSDSSIIAIYKYLSKRSLISDLVECGVLTLDGSELDIKRKIGQVSQADVFIRFAVSDASTNKTVRVWKSEELFDKYAAYCESLEQEKELCYVSGEVVPVTYKHMNKIRNSSDKAKLISSNDNENFTYRGVFENKEEAVAVGKGISQKAHLALRWLMETGGVSVGSAKYVAWESRLNAVPNVFEEFEPDENDAELFFDENADDDGKFYAKTAEQYKEIVGMAIKGYKRNLGFDSKVILMAVDAATTGRLSVILYQELKSTVFYDNLRSWYSSVSWHGSYFTKNQKLVHCVKTPTPLEIISCAYGNEDNNGKLRFDTSTGLYKSIVKQLYPCITMKAALPQNILKQIFIKASSRHSYKNEYNWKKVVDVCCALYRKYYNDKKGVEYNMKLDINCDDRSYLYGRLMALAEKIELDTYKNGEGRIKKDEVRMTNAARFMNSVIESPSKSWGNVMRRLQPYMKRILSSSYGSYAFYQKEFAEIYEKFKPGEYEQKKALEPLFFMGYYGEQQYLYSSRKNENDSTDKDN